MADQWKEYFYCDSLDADTLVVKGQKRTNKKRSSNKRGDENIISNGSVIAVADGQCMMIVEQGKVVEVSAEAGEFVWDSSTQPSLFAGSFGRSLLDTFGEIGKRFTFGGSPAADQRVYYFNLKEIMGNKYGTVNPIPFRVVDHNIGLDVDIAIRCNGEYSYKIKNPILFYTNVCGNAAERFERSQIDSMLKSELLTALQPAMARISEKGIRYSALPGHTEELADALNEVLSEKWLETRGLAVASFGVNSVTASEEDETMIKTLQRTAVYRNTGMAGAALVDAQTEAMKAAASNTNGAMMGFMGMNMAMQAGGASAEALLAMNQTQEKKQPAPAKAAADTWTCACGAVCTGKFCTECGAKRPADGWICACGATNKGKFCSECGAKKPAGALLYRCDKCGWEPEDPSKPPRFCPECGDVFDAGDIK
jgi:membrane protease subunit (stomatin/prohibitin family)